GPGSPDPGATGAPDTPGAPAAPPGPGAAPPPGSRRPAGPSSAPPAGPGGRRRPPTGGRPDPGRPGPAGTGTAARPAKGKPATGKPNGKGRPAPPRTRTGERPPASRETRRDARRPGLAPVYDVDGPRIRLAVACFLGALVALVASPYSTVLLYGAAAGLAARQIAKAWRSVSWQVDLATGLGALPVVAAIGGTTVAA